MDIVEVLKAIGGGETISVIAILVAIVVYGEKRFRYVEKKHDDEMAKLKQEYSEIIKLIKEENEKSLTQQREAHKYEKTEFFMALNATLKDLVKEIQLSNEVRNKIAFDMGQMQKYQDEVRFAIEHFKTEQELIKNTLLHNSEILSALIKCDLKTPKMEHR